MQFFKISLSQVVVAGLLVTSAAGAPLPRSGDLAIRDDFSVAGVNANAHLDARDPSKIGRFFKKAFRKIKPIVSTAADIVLKRETEPSVEIGKRGVNANAHLDARDPSKIGRFFKKAFRKIKPIVSTAADIVLKRETEPSVDMGKRDAIETRDVDESAAEYAELADESAEPIEARGVDEHWE
ncbi:hypothetical protein MAPG_04300 [Magnaporthiopsis poae ATCC 64411]|uniref:Uncharacterized protein n=1 Tax=Magnaporthiopsis poae (strain ATCC 64411 / 73-15) TaxID=644358 RepID=A0A0C4DWC4_MAGP6|nr:hypothetical protein MAPG_04300 [Magnaporthiopsis poae ATCC 64411]